MVLFHDEHRRSRTLVLKKEDTASLFVTIKMTVVLLEVGNGSFGAGVKLSGSLLLSEHLMAPLPLMAVVHL